MSLLGDVFRRATKRVWVKAMERAGKLVGRVVDTSADSPDFRYKPKRDLYAKMREDEERAAREGEHAHEHEHEHDHGHDDDGHEHRHEHAHDHGQGPAQGKR